MSEKPRVREATEEWVVFAKEQQERLKLSQAAIAERADVSAPTVSDLFRGVQTTSDRLDRIDRALEIAPLPEGWELIARRAKRDGYLAELLEWVALGQRAAELKILRKLTRAARAMADEMSEGLPSQIDQSVEIVKRPAPLPIVEDRASDRAGTKGHGKGKSRGR